MIAMGAPSDISADSICTGAAYLANYDGDTATVMAGGSLFGAAVLDGFGFAVVGEFGIPPNEQFGLYFHAVVGVPDGDYSRIYRLNRETVPATWEEKHAGLIQGTDNERCGHSLSMASLFAAVGCPRSQIIRIYGIGLGT